MGRVGGADPTRRCELRVSRMLFRCEFRVCRSAYAVCADCEDRHRKCRDCGRLALPRAIQTDSELNSSSLGSTLTNSLPSSLPESEGVKRKRSDPEFSQQKEEVGESLAALSVGSDQPKAPAASSATEGVSRLGPSAAAAGASSSSDADDLRRVLPRPWPPAPPGPIDLDAHTPSRPGRRCEWSCQRGASRLA